MTSKIALPAFLKLLTDGNITMANAMAIASKIYKTHNTPSKLSQLTDLQLVGLNITSKEERKGILAAIKKAGYRTLSSKDAEGRSNTLVCESETKNVSRKRRRDEMSNEILPEGPTYEGAMFGSFEFNEILAEENIKTKSAIVNRAPVMTAWATVVAECLGFQREEALSIASAYTEMNAISKGVSLGVFERAKGKGIELSSSESQPYVDLMGRRPLFVSKTGQWRALIKGEPLEPSAAYSYISRSFRQTMPHIVGAMRLLASTHEPKELNKKGFALYADFRPDVDGWGKRAEVKCKTILDLRKLVRNAGAHNAGSEAGGSSGEVTKHANDDTATLSGTPSKRVKMMTLDEYESLLEDDSTFYDNLAIDEG